MSKLTVCKVCSKDVAKTASTCPHCGAGRNISFLRKLIIGGLSFLGFLIFVGLVSGGNSRNSSNGNSVEMSLEAKSPVKPKIVEVSINRILSDYENNEVAADNSYKGKWIQVEGAVGDIKKDILGNLYVTLGTGKPFEIPMIQAFFNDENNSALAQFSKGQKITVVCKVDGLLMNVVSKDCSVK